MDLIKIVGTSIGSVIVLFILTKIMGNKQMSQLSMFDYINGITIGSISAEMATSLEGDFMKPLIAMIVYASLATFISYITCKSIKLRRFFTGKSIILLNDGKIYEKNLLKSKIDIDDFLTQCRIAGYFNLSEIQTALLETNGQISLLPKAESRPVNTADLNINAVQEKIVANVIMDGKILAGNLKHTGNDEQWLQKQLKSQGVGNIKDVFLATCDGENNLSVYVKISKLNSTDVFD